MADLPPAPARQRRTRPTVETELSAALGRITALRKSPEWTDPDSSARRTADWYSTRAELLQKELDAMPVVIW